MASCNEKCACGRPCNRQDPDNGLHDCGESGCTSRRYSKTQVDRSQSKIRDDIAGCTGCGAWFDPRKRHFCPGEPVIRSRIHGVEVNIPISMHTPLVVDELKDRIEVLTKVARSFGMSLQLMQFKRE